MKKVLALILSIQLFGCTPKSEPIQFGHDQCVHCKMTIIDTRYGAELVTKKGKVFKYDAAECLINALYKDKIIDEDDVHSLWVVDFTHPATLTDATSCYYLQTKALPSPMGMYITAIADKQKAEELIKQHQPLVLDWKSVCELVVTGKLQ